MNLADILSTTALVLAILMPVVWVLLLRSVR
jgi:hypothetical protein